MTDPRPAAPPASSFLRANLRWLAVGFLLALGSSFGQTYFISIFSAPIRETLSLSHGAFGGIYAAATLASAATLVQLGRLADSAPPRRLALGVIGALALACLGMTVVGSALALLLTIYALRLFGQGMMSHLSQTLIARMFVATRGKALAVASFGYPLGEALAPSLAVFVIAAYGWRSAWLLAALALALVFAPALWALLAEDRTPQGAAAAGRAAAPGLDGRHWTRAQALRHPWFWLLLPGVMSTSFILTNVFFLPDVIAADKGWTLAEVATRYPVYAAVSVAASVAAGALVDRFSARACLAVYPLPMAAGLALLAAVETPDGFVAVMALCGMTAGAASTILGALWAELYGAAHLGAIKALGHAAMVVGSALGPGVAGVALDAGAPLSALLLAMAAYALAAAALYAATALWIGRAVTTAPERPSGGR